MRQMMLPLLLSLTLGVAHDRWTDDLPRVPNVPLDELADQLLNAFEGQFLLFFPNFEEHAEEGLPFLFEELDCKPEPDASNRARDALARRQANAAVALLRLNLDAKVWPLLKHSPDPGVRSYLIHRMGPRGVDIATVTRRVFEESDMSIRRALVLSLGEFDERDLSPQEKMALVRRFQDIYQADADPGLHAATEWLLRKWKQDDWLKQVNEQWAKGKESRAERLLKQKHFNSKDNELIQPQWYVNGQGQTMVVIPSPADFLMGSPATEDGRQGHEEQHKVRIDRRFAISSKEVTAEQFLRFHKNHKHRTGSAPTDDYCPAIEVTWFDAVAYCNWLSEQEGIPRDQWCYRPNKDGEYGPGMTMAPQFLQREGYRLPSNAEWEYSCRAGSGTRYCFGESDELLFMYAWYRDNPLMVGSRCHPVGSLKPNDFGLFEMHGNITEWCQDDSLASVGANSSAEQDNDMEVTAENSRVTRNGSFHQASSRMRSAHFWDGLASSSGSIGFRLARTLPLVRAPGSLPVPTEGDGTGKTHE